MRRMMYMLAAVLMLSPAAVSCVHFWPETLDAQVDLTLKFDTEMDYFRTVKFPDETGSYFEPADDPNGKPGYFDNIRSDWQTGSEEYRIRYIVEAYRQFANGRYGTDAILRQTFYDDDATCWDDYHCSVKLPEGNYIFKVWADYIRKDSFSHLYYDATSFSGIFLDHTNGHTGNTDFRDAYSGQSDEVTVIRYGTVEEPVHMDILMARPLGKYVFVTNDLDEFVTKTVRMKMEQMGITDITDPDTKIPEFNIEDYTLTIRCTQFLPTSYSIHSDSANDSQVNIQFKSGLKRIDDKHATMGFDYVFANGADKFTNVVMGITLQDKDGTVLTTHDGLYVPLKRSKMTLVEGSFLIQESGGGIVLDPGFSGDINFPVQ